MRVVPPRLLVVTPTLGRSPFMREAVASIRRLDLPVQHVIVAPEAALGRLTAAYPESTIVAEERRGMYAAINRGIGAAGPWDWFTYLNDDDVLADGFEELVRKHWSAPDPEPVAYGDVRLIDRAGRNLGLIPIERRRGRFRAVIANAVAPFSQQGSITHRDVFSAIGGFDEKYAMAGDRDHLARALIAGCRFRYFPIETARWRVHVDQLSQARGDSEREVREIAERVRAGVPAWSRLWGRFAFYCANAPRYAQRVGTTGRVTSAAVFAREARRSGGRSIE